jgi:predicted enzyme related to lactoylglutathione lyase
MFIKFSHTNIISKNWKKLAQFYIDVFDCKTLPPERNLSGEWLDEGTGVKNAHLRGIHLKLPGYGDDGPTLEIFEYDKMEEKPKEVRANRMGFGHIAFQVDDVEKTIQKVLENGGKKLGEISEHFIEGVGKLKYIYVTDTEYNIIEIQRWN